MHFFAEFWRIDRLLTIFNLPADSMPEDIVKGLPGPERKYENQ